MNNDALKLINDAEGSLKETFEKIDEMAFYNSQKVLDAFHKNQVSTADFNGTTGYGYDDLGRDKTEAVFADALGAEDALVRSQFISGTHAITTAFFALLRPFDTFLSITGKPYDTLDEVIGLRENESSLKAFNINYEQIDLVNDDFDYDLIKKTLREEKIKLIEIQRSKGYSLRKSISIDKVAKVIKEIRSVSKDVIIMVDNCYCEFVSKKEPVSVGADIMVGSLIKNLGAGIAPNGAYVAGTKKFVELVASRLNVPGQAKEVGPSMGMTKLFLQGLYMAPSAVAASLKTAILTSYILEKLGYKVEPRYQDERCDIVQNIYFGNAKDMINYCGGIQQASAIDAFATPVPTNMPGYKDQIIMASGSFTQGSSIELSCDGPIRPPYVLYQQGSLTYEYGKLGILHGISKLLDKKL